MKQNGFFAMVARMKHITRWGLMKNTMRESLTEHSFDTAVIAHALAEIGNTYFGKQIDAGQIAAVALFHDTPEILTGDMPTPVKYNNPDIREAFRSVEFAAQNSLISMLPKELRPRYQVLFQFEHEQPEYYLYVKAADKISAYLKCIEEEKSGNTEFANAKEQTLQSIRALHLPEADYYMQHLAPAYQCTLDELQNET